MKHYNLFKFHVYNGELVWSYLSLMKRHSNWNSLETVVNTCKGFTFKSTKSPNSGICDKSKNSQVYIEVEKLEDCFICILHQTFHIFFKFPKPQLSNWSIQNRFIEKKRPTMLRAAKKNQTTSFD